MTSGWSYVKMSMSIFAAIVLFSACNKNIEDDIRSQEKPNKYQQLTGSDSEEEKEKWDQYHKGKALDLEIKPNSFIKEAIHFLPSIGTGLVIPMDEGHEAVYLARHGLTMSGLDFSAIALQKANRLAHEHGIALGLINSDVTQFVFEPKKYDVIVNVLLHRPPLPERIKAGLKPGGTVVYVAETTDLKKLKHDRTIREEYLLKPGELRDLFKGFEILLYKEETKNNDAIAEIVARKPKDALK